MATATHTIIDTPRIYVACLTAYNNGILHGRWIDAALLDHYSGDLDEIREAIEDRYHGCHASVADYVQELTEETMQIRQNLRYCIDWQSMVRDAEMSGDFFTVETAWNEVHVFAGY